MKKYFSRKWVILSSIAAFIVGANSLFNSFTYSYIFKILQFKLLNQLLWFIIVYILGSVFFAIMDYVRTIFVNRGAASFTTALKTDLLSTVALSDKAPSDKLSIIVNDVEYINDNYYRNIIYLVMVVTSFVLTLAFSIQANWQLTIIFLVFTAIGQAIPQIYQKRMAKATEDWSEKVSVSTNFLTDFFNGIQTILNYGVMGIFRKNGNKKIGEAENAKATRNIESARTTAIIYSLVLIFQGIPIGLGMLQVLQSNLSISQFVAVQFGSTFIVNAVLEFSQAYNEIISTKATREKILDILKNKNNNLDESVPNIAEDSFEKLNIENLSFAYNPENEKVIDNLSLTVNKGEKLLITGASGSGKSTLLNLITGRLKPDTGDVLLDVDNEEVLTRRELFSIVTQDSSIFTGTLRFNLTLGKDFSEKQIFDALELADLSDFATTDKLEESLSEAGSNLSGGQKKRIELARAFLFNRPILIVDEGTASLDEKSANHIHDLLLSSNRTIIEVDHHIPEAIAERFNKHIQFLDGKIIEG